MIRTEELLEIFLYFDKYKTPPNQFIISNQIFILYYVNFYFVANYHVLMIIVHWFVKLFRQTCAKHVSICSVVEYLLEKKRSKSFIASILLLNGHFCSKILMQNVTLIARSHVYSYVIWKKLSWINKNRLTFK